MQLQDELGVLGLAGKLKHLSDKLFKQSEQLFTSQGVNIPVRSFGLLKLLALHGSCSVTELAELLGHTHPAISQLSKKLVAEGLVYQETDVLDERRRLLALTPQGYELVDLTKNEWQSLALVINRISDAAGSGLEDNISLLDRELNKTSLFDRVIMLKREQQTQAVEIVHYNPAYAKDFYRLNRQWLEKYFYIESIDHEVLSNPQTYIIDKGGFILMARLEQAIIGTAALIVGEDNSLELSKMSVDEAYQGLGVGEKLARAAINQFRATDFKKLFLESNRKLLPAINLYSKLGFVEKPAPFEQSHYSRADIYMEFVE